jgi:hypothetical protein
MVTPLLSVFLEYAKGDTDNNKQDCEQRAFHQLSKRLKQLFPRLGRPQRSGSCFTAAHYNEDLPLCNLERHVGHRNDAARLMVDLIFRNTLFEPLASRFRLGAEHFGH